MGLKNLALLLLLLFLVWGEVGAFSVLKPKTLFRCSSVAEVSCKGLFPPHKAGDNQTFLLKKGENALAYRVKLIKEAKKSIRIQTFIWKNDEAGRYLANLLMQRRREGIRVILILDGLGNFEKARRDLFLQMKAEGIEIVGYESRLKFVWNELFGSAPGGFFHRYHEKVMVVDGETDDGIAIMGGMNIANEYFRIAEDHVKLWTDMDIVFKGTAVKDALKLFNRNKNYQQHLVESGHSYNDKSGLDIWNMNFDESAYVPYPIAGNVSPIEPKNKLEKMTERFANLQPDFVVHDDVKLRIFGTRPRINENYIMQVYEKMINEAKREILIANAYYIPHPRIRKALRNAIKRGVKVHIVTNGPEASDIGVVVTAARYYYHELIAASFDPLAVWNGGSIRIYEWIGKQAGEGTIHSKWAAFDRRAAIVGSYNLAPRSDYFDTENVVVVEGRKIGLELAKYFHEDHLKFNRRTRKFKYVKEISPRQAERYFNNTFWEAIKTSLALVIEKML